MKSRLEQVMKDKGVTIRELEKLSGVTTVTIVRARKDGLIGRCSLDTIQKLATALGCSVYDLFTPDPAQDPADPIQADGGASHFE